MEDLLVIFVAEDDDAVLGIVEELLLMAVFTAIAHRAAQGRP